MDLSKALSLSTLADATPAEQNHALKLFICVAVLVGLIIFLTRDKGND